MTDNLAWTVPEDSDVPESAFQRSAFQRNAFQCDGPVWGVTNISNVAWTEASSDTPTWSIA